MTSPIAFLCKQLSTDDRYLPTGDWQITPFSGSDAERDSWLSVQNEAFAAVRAVRPWGIDHWQRELLSRSWWSPARLWLAHESGTNYVVGTVALELRQHEGQLHWLAVRPKHQRQGIASALLGAAEQACRDQRITALVAETLAGSDAEQFYRSHHFR